MTETASVSLRRLNPLSVVLTAAATLWDRRAAFIRSLWIPVGILVVSNLIQAFSPYRLRSGLQIVLAVPRWFALVVFAVACHRLVILGEDSIPRFGLLKWTWREWRFFGWTLVIGMLAAFQGYPGQEPAVFLILVPLAYVAARLSLLLPATAVDRQLRLVHAWRLTHGNGWRLALLIVFLPGLLGWGIRWMHRTMAAYFGSAGAIVVHNLIWVVVFAFQITFLSVAFWTLYPSEDDERPDETSP